MKIRQSRTVFGVPNVVTIDKIKNNVSNEHPLELDFKEELIGKIIKQARERKRVTQERLAEQLGINKSNISKIENNLTSIRMETFFKVMQALDTKVTVKLEFEK